MQYRHIKECITAIESHPMHYGYTFLLKNHIQCYIDVLLNALLLNDIL